MFQCLWTSQEDVMQSLSLKSDCCSAQTRPPRICDSQPRWSVDSITSQPPQPVSTAAREPSKEENPTSNISITSCRLFSNMDPREKEEMIQNILQEKHHPIIRMGHSVYLLFVPGNENLNSFIPVEQSVWFSLSKRVKSRLVLCLSWT